MSTLKQWYVITAHEPYETKLKVGPYEVEQQGVGVEEDTVLRRCNGARNVPCCLRST